MRCATGATAVITAERRAAVLELRKQGNNLREIGRKLGMSKQAAHKHLRVALAQLNGRLAETAEEVRRIELETLADLQAAVIGRARTVDDDGQDKAISAVLGIMDRRAKLLGLDAAQRHQVDVALLARITDAQALEIPAVRSILDVVTRELAPYPEARAAVLQALGVDDVPALDVAAVDGEESG